MIENNHFYEPGFSLGPVSPAVVTATKTEIIRKSVLKY